MTAASGDPGERPDYAGHPPDVPGFPSADPAYGGWQPAQPPAADYPPDFAPPAGPPPGYAAAPGPPFQGYPAPYGAPYGNPGYPGYPGYPPPAAEGTNMLAIVSLVSSVSGLLCFVGSLAGIITGLIAIGQVKRTGQRGYGLAVAGTVAGVAGLVLYLVMVASAVKG